MTPSEVRALSIAEFRALSEYAVQWLKEHADGG